MVEVSIKASDHDESEFWFENDGNLICLKRAILIVLFLPISIGDFMKSSKVYCVRLKTCYMNISRFSKK